MGSIATSMEQDRSGMYRAILWGGALAGTLDITTVFVLYAVRGTMPAQILQAIASGLLGMNAFTDGWGTAALGGLLHFFIAFVVAAVYVLASRRFSLLVEQAIVGGLLYGVAVQVVMNWIVVPLSAAPFPPPPLDILIAQFIIHMVCIGLPIALVTRRFAA